MDPFIGSLIVFLMLTAFAVGVAIREIVSFAKKQWPTRNSKWHFPHPVDDDEPSDKAIDIKATERWIRNWHLLSSKRRKELVDHLLTRLRCSHEGDKTLAYWIGQKRAGGVIGGNDPFFHHCGDGLWVKNTLRSELDDRYLPGGQTWDSCYYGALDELCGRFVHDELWCS